MSVDPCYQPLGRRIGRHVIKICFAGLVILHTIDAMPWGVLPHDVPKPWVADTMQSVGLGTGPWTMFTPNPVADNSWLSATIAGESPSPTEWNSPNWAAVSAADRFIQFRSINYFNRVAITGNRPGAEDFAEYLRRQSMSADNERPSIVLSVNGLKVVIPIEGGVPLSDDVIRMLHSQTIVRLDASP